MKALGLHDQLVKEGCIPDQKTYVALVRGCLQAGLVDQAAAVVRCAFHCGEHSMLHARGSAPGVDPACLQEVISKMGSGSISQKLAADVASAQKAAQYAGSRTVHGNRLSNESLPWRVGNKPLGGTK